MENTVPNLIDRDAQLALQRYRGNATPEEMLRWINHNFRRKYQLQEFKDSLEKAKTEVESAA
jgi:hypothetical protein